MIQVGGRVIIPSTEVCVAAGAAASTDAAMMEVWVDFRRGGSVLVQQGTGTQAAWKDGV